MDLATTLLAHAWQASAFRQKTLASDIANIDTPGFAYRDVSFTKSLANALQSGGDAAAVKAKMVTLPGVYSNDGNGVDPDRVMAALAKNQVRYDVLAQELHSRFNQFKTAITGE